MSNVPNKEFGVSIIGITEDSFYFKTLSKSAIESFDVSKLYVKLAVKFDFEHNDNLILTVYSDVTYDYVVSDDQRDSIVNIVSKIDYLIRTDNKSIKEDEDGKLNIPSELLHTLVSSSFATTRGMLAVKTAGTYISKYPLQLISHDKIDTILNHLNDDEATNEPKIFTQKKSVSKKK